MLPLFVVLPLFCAFLSVILSKFKKIYYEVLVNIINFVLVVLAFYLLYLLNISTNKYFIYQVGGHKFPIGISMYVDFFSVFMLLFVNIIGFFVGLYSVNYMEKYTEKGKFYSLFELIITGMNGIIISGDLFNIFVFLEIASVASYALVAFGTESDELEASFKYLVLSSIASSFIFLGIILTYSYTSTLNLIDISNSLGQSQGYIVKIILLIFFLGFSIKAALVPFHSWLPDAHTSAPTPVSAILSGVLIKTLGVYLIVRFVYNVFPLNLIMLKIIQYLGLLSMIVGSILMIYQWDYKRLLAYSSISQVGYILLGIGLATPLSIIGSVLHLINHSFIKSLLFLTSGSLEYVFKTRNLKELSNFELPRNKTMPITNFSAIIGSLSIAGIPPLNGFWSKLVLIIACVIAKDFISAIIAILVSILTLSSFLKVLKYAFYSTYENQEKLINNIEKKEVPFLMQLSMLSLSVFCILMGLLLYPDVRKVLMENIVNVFIK